MLELAKAVFQIVLFSATFPDNVIGFAQKFAPRSNELTLRHEELTVEGIKQLYMDCASEQDKYDVLVKLYGLMTIGSSIIFVKVRNSMSTFFCPPNLVQKRATATEIQRRMSAEGHKVVSLTGDYEPHQRDMIIDAFRTGEAKVLIATNVLARGIDVQSVSMVVNYVCSLDDILTQASLTVCRMFQIMAKAKQTHKHTFIALAVQDALVVSAFLSLLCMTKKAGSSSWISRTTSESACSGSRLRTGTPWRKRSRRSSKALQHIRISNLNGRRRRFSCELHVTTWMLRTRTQIMDSIS